MKETKENKKSLVDQINERIAKSKKDPDLIHETELIIKKEIEEKVYNRYQILRTRKQKREAQVALNKIGRKYGSKDVNKVIEKMREGKI